MQPRIAYAKIAPSAMKAMRGLEAYLAECGLEPSLLATWSRRAPPRSTAARIVLGGGLGAAGIFENLQG